MNYKKLRALREAKGMTQQQLGEIALVPQTMLCRIEKGVQEPSIAALRRLADALGVTAAELI